jgi:hypothetical protein
MKKLMLLVGLFLWIVSLQGEAQKQQGQKGQKGKDGGHHQQHENIDLTGNVLLGCPTDQSIVVSVIAKPGMEAFVEYSVKQGIFDNKSATGVSKSGDPIDITLSKLKSNSLYFYRVSIRQTGDVSAKVVAEGSFMTQRKPGASFSFGVQGDSHPEREGKMFDAQLYRTTMTNVAAIHPDFYFLMGDDFSIDKLLERQQGSQQSVDAIYLSQRQYLSTVARQSPLFLVNGNHEQAAKYLLDGTENNPAVWAARSRIKYYPLPSPDNFYGGNSNKIEPIGLVKDYYSFEWGNALFVVIDPYWHTDSVVDNKAGSRDKGKRDLWDVTLGNEQYQWLKSTLENSKATYKFVFCHHVLGTGRGGIEDAKLCEWGGYSRQGVWEFNKKRPGWELPIHQLMVKNKVTIFFQGHDHLYVRQELDGVVYQTVPIPADSTYTLYNDDAYLSGVKYPNSGFLNVTVSDHEVKVDYIRSFLPNDENAENKNGVVAYSYCIK